MARQRERGLRVNQAIQTDPYGGRGEPEVRVEPRQRDEQRFSTSHGGPKQPHSKFPTSGPRKGPSYLEGTFACS